MAARGVEIGAVLMLVFQGIPLASRSRRIMLEGVLESVSKSDSVVETRGNDILDLGDSMSDTTVTTDENVLKASLVEFSIGGGDEGRCWSVRARMRSLDSPILVFNSLSRKVRACRTAW